jgi:hypothetical protein
MKKEWQVDIHGGEWPVDADGIVTGDEGCIHRALNPGWIRWVEQAEKRDYPVRYVTPPVPNQYTEELFRYISNLADITRLKVTFNDYGMLYRCKELIEKTKIVPVLGRVITHSITDCPWHEELLKHEAPGLAVAVTGSNLAHPSKWEVFREFNILEIELNILHREDLADLHENNLVLIGYNSNLLISVGRVCFSARWQGLKLPDCCNDERCRTKLALEIDKTWGKMKLMYEEPSEPVKFKYRDLFVRGNIVYQQLPERLNVMSEPFFDHQIYDHDPV